MRFSYRKWDGTDFPTQEHWEVFETRLRSDLARVNPQLGGARLASMVDRQLERYVVDPSLPFPVLGNLFGDGAGGVWIGDYVIRGDPGGSPRFAVISPEGR